uniref:Calcium-binding mitochondrial carrier protein SCaMC-1 n=1 Tax=Phallusia mammillata TaxID=59560 RepID=A0A6F9DTH8_9ASCI|nr:calcium-binding mitochondrial carrier protein SCaMC-1 [Phallusia mammillata]
MKKGSDENSFDLQLRLRRKHFFHLSIEEVIAQRPTCCYSQIYKGINIPHNIPLTTALFPFPKKHEIKYKEQICKPVPGTRKNNKSNRFQDKLATNTLETPLTKWTTKASQNLITHGRKKSFASQLDLKPCSLNLNELSLPEVHHAMGKEGCPLVISPDKEAYYIKIFKQLDVDNDGRVDVDELKQAYKKMGLLQVPGQAEKFVSASDMNKDGELDVSEFVRYLHEHEMKLSLMFKRMDQDKDGKLTHTELREALRSVGVDVTKEEAVQITQRMDKDGTSTVDLEEWIAHHLLHPSADIKDMISYWKHGTYIDIGESLIVPDDFSEEEKVSGLWWRQLVAGGAAGVVSRTCTAPLDRLKVLMQVHASKSNNLGIVSGMKSMLKEGGIKSLWRGNGINVIKIAPETAVKFMAYEKMKYLIGAQSQSEIGAPQKFIAGSTAGVISQTTIYPMEVIKTRLALRKTGQYKGIFDCAVKVFRHEGPGAFFKGYIPNCLGIIPYAGIDLCIYETLKNFWIKNYSAEKDRPSVPLLLACGTISSTCGQLSSYPLALVRTKMQAQASLPDSKHEKVSMVSLFRSIVQNEGVFGLYRGLAPNFMKVVPAVSISYVVYENMRMQLGVYR